MPSWGKILEEINQANQELQFRAVSAQQAGRPLTSIDIAKSNPIDGVRQKYIRHLSDYTKRDTIVYATRWTSGDTDASLVSITDEDVQGFMEAVYGLKSRQLDLILHTPGGSAEATEAIISYEFSLCENKPLKRVTHLDKKSALILWDAIF